MQASAAARATLSRWYWAVPYLAVTVLALSMLAVVWLLQERETEVERDALARDLQWTEQSIRRAMLTTEEVLVQLARDLSAGTLDHDGFQLRANEHLAINPPGSCTLPFPLFTTGPPNTCVRSSNQSAAIVALPR